MVEFERKWSKTNIFCCFGCCFRYKSTFNRLYNCLIDFFDLLIELFDLLIELFDLKIELFDLKIKLFDLKIDLLFEIDRIYIEKDWFYIEIVNSDSSLDFESDRNRQSRSTVLESKSWKIRFVSPNRISLPYPTKRRDLPVYWLRLRLEITSKLGSPTGSC